MVMVDGLLLMQISLTILNGFQRGKTFGENMNKNIEIMKNMKYE